MPVAEAEPKPIEKETEEQPKSDEKIEITEEKEVIFNNEEEARNHLKEFITSQHDAEKQYFETRYKDKELTYKEKKPGFLGLVTKIENATIWSKNQMIKLGNWFEDQTHLRERFGSDEHGKLKSGVIKTLMGGGGAASLYAAHFLDLGIFSGAGAGLSVKTAIKGIVEIKQSFNKEYRDMKRDIVAAKKELEYVGPNTETLGEMNKRIKCMHEASERLLKLRQQEAEEEKKLEEQAEKYSSYGAMGFFLLFGAPMGVQKYGGFEAVKKLGKQAGKEIAVKLTLPSGHNATFNGLLGYLYEKGLASFTYNAGEAEMARNFANMTGYKLSQSSDFLGQFKHILKPSSEVLWKIGETALSYSAGVFGHHKISSKLRERNAEKFADGIKAYEKEMEKAPEIPIATLSKGANVEIPTVIPSAKVPTPGVAESVEIPSPSGVTSGEVVSEIPKPKEETANIPVAEVKETNTDKISKLLKQFDVEKKRNIVWLPEMKKRVSEMAGITEEDLDDYEVKSIDQQNNSIKFGKPGSEGTIHKLSTFAGWVRELTKSSAVNEEKPTAEKSEEAKAPEEKETKTEGYKIGDIVEFKRKDKKGNTLDMEGKLIYIDDNNNYFILTTNPKNDETYSNKVLEEDIIKKVEKNN
jgi:hypothetical protein